MILQTKSGLVSEAAILPHLRFHTHKLTMTSPTSTQPTSAYPSLHSKPLRMSYRIARGEQGVLTFEPYKSLLLPLWRFRTPPIARQSSADLWHRFLDYDAAGDFVGMDMARKFIQMGMTRAKRYANHKGGRKYEVATGDGGGRGRSKVKARSEGHADKEEKEMASKIFREVWERCKVHEGYVEKKRVFLEEQREWDEEQANVDCDEAEEPHHSVKKADKKSTRSMTVSPKDEG